MITFLDLLFKKNVIYYFIFILNLFPAFALCYTVNNAKDFLLKTTYFLKNNVICNRSLRQLSYVVYT